MRQHFSTDFTGKFARLYIFFPPDPMKCYCIISTFREVCIFLGAVRTILKLVSTLSIDNLL